MFQTPIPTNQIPGGSDGLGGDEISPRANFKMISGQYTTFEDGFTRGGKYLELKVGQVPETIGANYYQQQEQSNINHAFHIQR